LHGSGKTERIQRKDAMPKVQSGKMFVQPTVSKFFCAGCRGNYDSPGTGKEVEREGDLCDACAPKVGPNKFLYDISRHTRDTNDQLLKTNEMLKQALEELRSMREEPKSARKRTA
jgi:hypothetical protein